MSNEFQENFNVNCTNGNYKFTFVKGSASYNQSVQGSVGGCSKVTTTASDVPLGSVGTLGKALFHNCDVTNYVQIGTDVTGTFTPFMKLLPDEYAWVRLDTITPMWKAHTASCDVEYVIFEN